MNELQGLNPKSKTISTIETLIPLALFSRHTELNYPPYIRTLLPQVSKYEIAKINKPYLLQMLKRSLTQSSYFRIKKQIEYHFKLQAQNPIVQDYYTKNN